MPDKSLSMDLLSKLEAALRNYSIKKENLVKCEEKVGSTPDLYGFHYLTGNPKTSVDGKVLWFDIDSPANP